MKRNHRPTRKRKALRRWGLLFVLLLLANWTSGAFALIPAQVLWDVERSYESGHTDVAYSVWDNRLRFGTRYYLSGNDEMLLFLPVRLTPLGWTQDSGSSILYFTQQEPYTLTESFWSRYDQHVYYFYGRIDDARIQSVKIEHWREQPPESAGASARIGEWSLVSDREDWVTKNGHTYVLATKELTAQEGEYFIDTETTATFYDSMGNILETTDKIPWSYTNVIY